MIGSAPRTRIADDRGAGAATVGDGSAVAKLRTIRGTGALLLDLADDTLAVLDAIRRIDDRLDTDMPGGRRRRRGRGLSRAVIVLTGRSDIVHRVRLLERGADDLLVSPM